MTYVDYLSFTSLPQKKLLIPEVSRTGELHMKHRPIN